MSDAIDMLLADMDRQTLLQCTAMRDSDYYTVKLISPGRTLGRYGAVTRAMAVGLVGERLVLRADAEPGVMQEEVEQ